MYYEQRNLCHDGIEAASDAALRLRRQPRHPHHPVGRIVRGGGERVSGGGRREGKDVSGRNISKRTLVVVKVGLISAP